MFFISATDSDSVSILDTDDFVIEKVPFAQVPNLVMSGIEFVNLLRLTKERILTDKDATYQFKSRLGYNSRTPVRGTLIKYKVSDDEFHNYLSRISRVKLEDLIFSMTPVTSYYNYVMYDVLDIWFRGYRFGLFVADMALWITLDDNEPVRLTKLMHGGLGNLRLIGKYKKYLVIYYKNLIKPYYFNPETGKLSYGIVKPKKVYDITSRMTKQAFARKIMFK